MTKGGGVNTPIKVFQRAKLFLTTKVCSPQKQRECMQDQEVYLVFILTQVMAVAFFIG